MLIQITFTVAPAPAPAPTCGFKREVGFPWMPMAQVAQPVFSPKDSRASSSGSESWRSRSSSASSTGSTSSSSKKRNVLNEYNASLGSIVMLPKLEGNRHLRCQSCKSRKHIITDSEKTVDGKNGPVEISALGHPAIICDIIGNEDEKMALVCIMSSRDMALENPAEETCRYSPLPRQPGCSFDERTLYGEPSGDMQQVSFVQTSHVFAVPFGNLYTCGYAFKNRITRGSFESLMKQLNRTPSYPWKMTHELKEQSAEMWARSKEQSIEAIEDHRKPEQKTQAKFNIFTKITESAKWGFNADNAMLKAAFNNTALSGPLLFTQFLHPARA